MRRVWAMLALMLAGCSTAGTAPTYPLSVQLADIRFAEAGLLEQSIGLDLRFTNPNPEPISADGLRFALDLQGESFGTGVSDDAFSIPRLGEVVVPVTIRVQTGELIERLLAFDGGNLDYRIEGDLFQARGLAVGPGRNIAFASESSIAVPKLEGLLERLQGTAGP